MPASASRGQDSTHCWMARARERRDATAGQGPRGPGQDHQDRGVDGRDDRAQGQSGVHGGSERMR
jgi:hypothetical protein